MGEDLLRPRYPDLQPHHHFQQQSPPLPPPQQHFGYGPHNSVPNGEEEPYTIKCICGFADDDGNTVLCEQCNTWQHIECYYYPTLAVPDVHKCADCSPRPLDSTGAAQRQHRQRNLVNTTDERRIKRTTNKGQKRAKTRDQNPSVAQQNGWPHADPVTLDTRNGIPWDQPPPAKRPKTNHRTSTSISTTKPVPLRDINGLQDQPVFKPPKLPLANCPSDYLSPDFIHLHRDQSNFTIAPANTHLNIDVANLLAKWLDDLDAFENVTQGKAQGDVFKYLPTPIEDVEAPIHQYSREDTSALFHGHHPVWKYVTVDRDTASGQMIGEIRGTIGLLNDYIAEPANDWERLRHPDHFVFFHPILPIFIDCRREGTLLRYVRRSCKPNIKIQTIITGEREYRFCFTAMEDIARGAELTVGWDLRYHPQLRDSVSSATDGKKMSADERTYLQNSIQTILAHFGDCACEDADNQACLMGRFDHRLASAGLDTTPPQPAKPGRKRKSMKRTPPRMVIDGISRAASEALQQEDDHDDSRSTSRSTHSKTSREGTPVTSATRDVTQELGPGLSERDKKKLIQQEMLFNKLEHDKQHGPRKKKRTSGSNVNTPSASNTKQSGRRNSITSNHNTTAPTPGASGKARASDQASAYFSHRNTPHEQSPQPQNPTMNQSLKPAVAETPAKPPKPPKPVYVSIGTQTDSTDDIPGAQPQPAEPKRFMSASRRLLERFRIKTSRNSSPQSSPQAPQISVVGEAYASSAIPNNLVKGPSSPQPPEPGIEPGDTSNLDVEMKDAESPGSHHETHDLAEESAAGVIQPPPPLHETKETNHHTAHPPIRPPPPPWTIPQAPLPQPSAPILPRTNIRAVNLHVDLPPPLPSTTSDLETPIAATPDPFTPATNYLAPPAAPMVPSMNSSMSSSITQPSPLKKKMSLSDYTAKLKAKTPGVEKSQSMGEPGSSSPAAPRPAFLSNSSIAEQDEPTDHEMS